jgi:hypothetical protein
MSLGQQHQRGGSILKFDLEPVRASNTNRANRESILGESRIIFWNPKEWGPILVSAMSMERVPENDNVSIGFLDHATRTSHFLAVANTQSKLLVLELAWHLAGKKGITSEEIERNRNELADSCAKAWAALVEVSTCIPPQEQEERCLIQTFAEDIAKAFAQIRSSMTLEESERIHNIVETTCVNFHGYLAIIGYIN